MEMKRLIGRRGVYPPINNFDTFDTRVCCMDKSESSLQVLTKSFS